jgi:hypothetical protein
VVAKRSEGLMIDKAAAAVETAGAVVQAVSTQVVSTQVAQTAVASQNDRLIR